MVRWAELDEERGWFGGPVLRPASAEGLRQELDSHRGRQGVVSLLPPLRPHRSAFRREVGAAGHRKTTVPATAIRSRRISTAMRTATSATTARRSPTRARPTPTPTPSGTPTRAPAASPRPATTTVLSSPIRPRPTETPTAWATPASRPGPGACKTGPGIGISLTLAWMVEAAGREPASGRRSGADGQPIDSQPYDSGYFVRPAVQSRVTVRGAVVGSPASVLTRKRCPSGETS